MTADESKALKNLMDRLNNGLPLSQEEDVQMMNLEGRLDALQVQAQKPAPKSVYELEMARWSQEDEGIGVEILNTSINDWLRKGY